MSKAWQTSVTTSLKGDEAKFVLSPGSILPPVDSKCAFKSHCAVFIFLLEGVMCVVGEINDLVTLDTINIIFGSS